MNLQDNIYVTVLQAKCTAACWAKDLIAKEKAGSDIKCAEYKLILLSKWIQILQYYYCKNFNSTGNITPSFVCLSADDVIILLAKVKKLIVDYNIRKGTVSNTLQ